MPVIARILKAAYHKVTVLLHREQLVVVHQGRPLGSVLIGYRAQARSGLMKDQMLVAHCKAMLLA